MPGKSRAFANPASARPCLRRGSGLSGRRAAEHTVAVCCLHGALEVGDFAGGDVDAPAADEAQGSFLEQLGGPRRMINKALAITSGIFATMPAT